MSPGHILSPAAWRTSFLSFFPLYCDNYAGGHGGADIPVPVPNTEVKRPSADGTASRRESRPPPAFSFFSSLRPGRAFRARRARFFPLPPLCRLSPRPPRRRLRRFPAGGAGRHLLLLRGERFLMSCGASAEKSQEAGQPPLWLCALWRRCLVGDSSGAGGVPERGGGMERAAADSPARGGRRPDKRAGSLPASDHSCAMPATGCVSPCVRCGSPASFVP